MSDREPFWDRTHPGNEGVPPVGETEVRRWEEQHAVKLPSSLARALTVQDVGVVSETDLWIHPLREFTPLSDPRWSHVHLEDEDRDDLDWSKLFAIGTTALSNR